MFLGLFRSHALVHLRSLLMAHTTPLLPLRRERSLRFSMRFSGITSASDRSLTRETTTQLERSGSVRYMNCRPNTDALQRAADFPCPYSAALGPVRIASSLMRTARCRYGDASNMRQNIC